jgi:hypothetical protein
MNFQKLDPIYYNLSLVNGYKNPNGILFSAVKTPAIIEEFNNQLILQNQSEYYVTVARATIPTSGIPRLIVPIQQGLLQNDKNKCIYTVKFRLCTGRNNGQFVFNPIYDQELAVSFISQYSFLFDQVKAPSNNDGKQDLRNSYYYIFDVEMILLMFNNTIKTLFATFCSQVGLAYNPLYYPQILWNSINRCFECIFPASVNGVSYFDQYSATPYPFIVFQLDALSSDLLQLSGLDDSATDNYISNLCFNKFNNVSTATISGNAIIYYTMTSSQSSLTTWGALSKIIFSISYGISTIQEYDSIPIDSQGNTNSNLLNKPIIPMLQDLEVDRDQFSINNNFIQYQTSSITQSRLVSMTGSMLQSFQLSVYWLDVFGVRNILNLPQGVPLTIKLAFYPKTTTII